MRITQVSTSTLISCLFISLIACAPQAAFSTAFTIIKTKKGWVVGSDSRRVSQDGKSGMSCKIRFKNGVVLIVWGPEWDGPPDLRKISQRYLDEEKGTAKGRSDELEKFIISDATFLQNTGSHRFGWAFIDMQGAFGYEHELDGSFKGINYSNASHSIYGTYCLGTASNRYLKTHLESGQPPDVDLATSLTRSALQAQADSPDSQGMVGAPFSIVLVSRSGIKWLDQDSCQASLVFQH